MCNNFINYREISLVRHCLRINIPSFQEFRVPRETQKRRTTLYTCSFEIWNFPVFYAKTTSDRRVQCCRCAFAVSCRQTNQYIRLFFKATEDKEEYKMNSLCMLEVGSEKSDCRTFRGSTFYQIQMVASGRIRPLSFCLWR